ncbi:SDR family NAD(P)-dependent oxidoreductase [Rhodococcus sp. G-MC3]|uniref:SDR family NAD(P)-dependent oxidoreductase n=1 Tax=Rhodococcus sp. G-MC3 TaxID=3046209 RepID=UPI0024B886F1|nr:SDR family NAD(P)-dependent oxidoreductase [Rhodococcus sp. G-MC3]MDJ0392661.1 SDR family NAD(P)-dependent oxidoreductase [Rhodococcus sp. G-MC3]
MFSKRIKETHRARAVVTGAGGGIGREIAVELGRRGSDVVCADIDLDGAENTAAAIRALGRTARAVRCDVADRSQLELLAKNAEEMLGGAVTLLVNNAGVGIGGQRIGEIGQTDWEWALGINLWGMINGCELFLPQITRAGHGGIINVSSAAAFAAAPTMAPYNVGKAGVLALSETLAAELAGTPLSVTVLCPTGVKTNIVANARATDGERNLGQLALRLIGMSPERVARRVLDGFDAGRLYVVPNPDAKLVWAAKRHFPRTYLAGAGVLQRLMPHASSLAARVTNRGTVSK